MNDLALLLDLFGNSGETKLLICTAIFVWCLQRHRNGGLNSGQKSAIIVTDASKNCGSPPGKKFDHGKGQSSRSPHGTNRKGLSQWSCMPSINALSLILQKIWARLKFLWRTEGRTDRRMSFNVPRFRERRGTIIQINLYLSLIDTEVQFSLQHSHVPCLLISVLFLCIGVI